MTPVARGTRKRPQVAVDACLIVRDEERNLADCVRSLLALRPLIREIHVYDTGSTDDTVALARTLGCHVVCGYWDDDFARARNESLKMSTAAWAIMIDADERASADVHRLAHVLESATRVDVFNASFSHMDEAGRVIGRSTYEKVVRVGAVEYVGRVHETLRRLDGTAVRSADLAEAELHFTHFGYATADIRRAKAERNAAVSKVDVQAALASGDQWWIGQAHYHHARSLQRLGATDPALAAIEAAREALPDGSMARDRVLVAHVGLLLEATRAQDAASAIGAHLASGGAAHVVRLQLARIALHSDRPVDALTALSHIPEAGDPEHEVDPRDVLRLRMSALDRLGRHDEALACCLLLVTRWADFLHVADLLQRVEGQDAGAVAALLRDAEPRTGLIDALTRDGSYGREVAAQMS